MVKFFSRLCLGAVSLVLAVAFLPARPANAYVMDMWYTTGNGTQFLDNFTVAGSMVRGRSATAPGSAAAIDGVLAIWALDFSDLHGVTYGGTSYGDIGVTPTGALGITLYGFDLGSYLGVDRRPEVRIFNGDYSAELIPAPFLSIGATHGHLTTSLYSPNGFHIQFEALSSSIGIDNLAFDVGNFAVVEAPVPGSALLFGSGLGAMGLRARRQVLAESGLNFAVCAPAGQAGILTLVSRDDRPCFDHRYGRAGDPAHRAPCPRGRGL